MKRLRPFTACKELYKTALDVYFRSRLDIVLSAVPDFSGSLNDDGEYPIKYKIAYGTFDEHQFFFRNTTKLRI